MHPLIELKLPEIVSLCRRHHVRRLEVFGSAASGRFDPQRSDVDFLVEYLPQASHGFRGDYFALQEGLEAVFGRGVDLVMTEAVRSPYFLRGIAKERTVIYEA